MIQNGINGILVNPAERELGLSKAMNKIISNEEFRSSIGNNALLLRDKFSIYNIIKKWDNVLDI